MTIEAIRDRCFYPMQESDRLAACNEFRFRHSNERGLVSYGDLWVEHNFTSATTATSHNALVAALEGLTLTAGVARKYLRFDSVQLEDEYRQTYEAARAALAAAKA